MFSLSLNLLGPFEASSGGEPITKLRSSKAQALLIYLAVDRTTKHRREFLFTLLWPGMPEKSARHNLRQTIYALRQIFPGISANDSVDTVPLILTNRQTVQLNPQAIVEIDLHKVDRLLDEMKTHDHPNLESCQTCIDALEEVQSLYRGAFLADFYLEDSNQFEEWAIAIREAYQLKILETLQTLTDIAFLKKNFAQAKEYAHRQLEIDPLKENAHRQLMEILARSGQRAAALRQYRNCEKILKDEFGVAPSTQTILLHEQIRTDKLPSSEAKPSIPPPPTTTHNLPHPVTSFIGRQDEIDKITNLIAENRLVTLTGAGGIGKTQLELQVGRRSLEAFRDGVWFIELAPIRAPELIPQTAAFALGLWESPSRPIQEQLIEYLWDKHCLMILDNCEHLIEAAAQFTETVLQSCPEVKILASSRETLGILGEITHLVPSLSFPSGDQAISIKEWNQYDSLNLFVERTRAVMAGFQVTDDNLPSLVRICQRLDGIPLALELAAARVNLLSLEQIAQRLNDRFNLLTEGSRTAPQRQQTLHNSIEWSWALLSAEEQKLMLRLSVFAGGMSLGAIESVCAGDGIESDKIFDLLTQLVNKSMLNMRRRQGEETRYQMLESIRQYAAEKLAESGE